MALPSALQSVFDRIRTVWSRERKAIEQATELSKGVVAPMGFDAFSVFGRMGMEPIQDYLRIEQDLMTRYLDVTEMEAYPEISVALDTWADEACQFDVLTGRTVWVESDDLQIKKLLNDLLDSHLEIDEEIWSIARALCKYGNVFEEPLITQEGVIGLNPLAPETVRRFEKGKGLLVGFAQDPRGVFGVTVEDIDNIVKGVQAPPPGIQIFEPWEVVHFRLLSRQRPSTYGIGVLEPARWIWRRLLLLEDAALIYRLTRTPTRWIFYIDVGKLPPTQALGQIRKIKNEFAKQKFVNERGMVDLRYNPLSCLTLDTRIPLLDGRELTLSEIIKEHEEGREHWVYSVNSCGETVAGRVSKAAVTRRNAELVRVTFSDGTSFRCTPDHRVYLEDGTQVQAKDLKSGSRCFCANRAEVFAGCLQGLPRWGGGAGEARRYCSEVAFVERLPERENTGCIAVEGEHNFSLFNGVFVHNSDENLFIPVVDGKRTTEVDLMATPEWQVMDDISYFRDKLFTAIKVPKAFLAAEEASRARLLSLQDLAFARSVMRVQRELRVGIRKICKLHLAALGIDPEKVSFDVYMTIPSWAYELSQLEVRNAKAEFADRVRGYLSERAVMKYVFGFSDDEIDALRSERDEEARRMAELGVEGPPEEKPRRRRGRTEGSTMDLPGISRILPRDDEHYSDSRYRLLCEQLDEILSMNRDLATYVEEIRSIGRDLRSGMFYKSTSGRTRLVHSFGNGRRLLRENC